MEEDGNNSNITTDVSNASDLMSQVEKLKEEKRKMVNEYDMQRARMKEYLLVRETELQKFKDEREALQREVDDLKSQFAVADLNTEDAMKLKDMKAQEEITSLQHLVQATMDESSITKAELDRVKKENIFLATQNRQLHETLQKKNDELQNPTPLVLRSLVRKFGVDTKSPFPSPSPSPSSSAPAAVYGNSLHQDSIDETTRNRTGAKQFAHEDSEVLHSIVEQLQEEMKVLKEKLRVADDKLQANDSNTAAKTATIAAKELINVENDTDGIINEFTAVDVASAKCDNCRSYETTMQTFQAKSTEDQNKIDSLQKQLDSLRIDMEKEAELRKVLEKEWQEKRETHKNEVQQLSTDVKLNKSRLEQLQDKFHETREKMNQQLHRVTEDRERVNKQLETLQADNDFLSGRYLKTSAEMERENIDLPNTVEQLQELMLCQRNQLILQRIGNENYEQKRISLEDEIQLLKYERDQSKQDLLDYKKQVQRKIKSLEERITEHLQTMQNYETNKIEMEHKEKELNRQICELRVDKIELQETNEKLSKINVEYKSKIKNLQDDLAMSEQVQKDFVQLSQKLQMTLEDLRHDNDEVRWEDDDDVDNCRLCNANFTVTVRKIHCRHCGRIYCDKCLTKNVESGPRKRKARVCDICHTLLRPNTAPYFSQSEETQQKQRQHV